MDSFPPTIGSGPRVYFSPQVLPKVPQAVFPLCRPVSPQAPQPDEALELMAYLFSRAGLEASHYRPSSLHRRLPACLRALGAADLNHAWHLMSRGTTPIAAVLDSVLLGVTDFFRDSAVFDQLEGEILPELLQQNERPRIWSAACSSGQELYSIALLLVAARKLETCYLLGTDCRHDALKEAALGHYPVKPGKAADPGVRRRFGPVSVIRIHDTVRRQLHWKCEDLFRRMEAGPWDMILWRNMAIYLNADSARRLWDGLVDELRPGGYLVTGRTETPPADLALIRRGPGLYQKPKTEGSDHGR